MIIMKEIKILTVHDSRFKTTIVAAIKMQFTIFEREILSSLQRRKCQ